MYFRQVSFGSSNRQKPAGQNAFSYMRWSKIGHCSHVVGGAGGARAVARWDGNVALQRWGCGRCRRVDVATAAAARASLFLSLALLYLHSDVRLEDAGEAPRGGGAGIEEMMPGVVLPAPSVGAVAIPAKDFVATCAPGTYTEPLSLSVSLSLPLCISLSFSFSSSSYIHSSFSPSYSLTPPLLCQSLSLSSSRLFSHDFSLSLSLFFMRQIDSKAARAILLAQISYTWRCKNIGKFFIRLNY